MKTVLLTGSEGYIGKSFKEKYKKEYNIVEIDKKLCKKAEEVVDFEGVDYIIHLAAISGILDCEKDPDQTFIDNVSSTLHLMKAAWAFNLPMVFASSQCAKTPASSLYASTKRIGEVEAIRYNNMNGNIACLRFSNVFGGKHYLKLKNSAVAKFIRATKNNENVIVNGDGSQTRDFIHVNEVCKAINLSLTTDSKIEYPVDVGTGIPRSVKQLAEMITDNIEYAEERDIGSESSIADTEPLKQLTGFEAEDKLEQYIRRAL